MRSVSLAVFSLCLVFIQAANANPPTAEDFVQSFYSVQISPDGGYVGTIRPHEGRSALYFYEFDSPPSEGHEPVSIIPSGDEMEIISFVWVSEERVLIQAGYSFWNTRYWGQQFEFIIGLVTHAVNIDGSNPLSFQGFGFSQIDSFLPEDPEKILIRGERIAYTLNIVDGRAEEVRAGRHVVGRIFADQSGRVRVMRRYTNGVYRLSWRDGNRWQEIYSEELGEDFDLRFFRLSGTGNEIYMTSHRDGRRGFYRIQPQQDSTLQPLYLDDLFDAHDIGFDRRTGDIQYVSLFRDRYVRVYFDDAFEMLNARVVRDLSIEEGFVIHSSLNGQRHVINGRGNGQPDRFLLFDQVSDTYREFASSFPLLDFDSLSPVQGFSFDARDGLSIPSYLTLPARDPEGPWPLVVLPHGGPNARDNMEFDAMRQFLVSRGYGVFQPNFRGSTGYGNAHLNAGRRQWGMNMQRDITDGVRYLIDQGIVDPEQICIMGWSYGGYAALHAVTQSSSAYKCAIGINGVYDLVELVQPSDGEFRDIYDGHSMSDLLPYEGQSESTLYELSPRYRADRISVPVLLVASEHDPIARIAQSRAMENAMIEAGVTHETLYFEEGDHSLTFGPARTAIYQRVEQFLAEHLQ